MTTLNELMKLAQRAENPKDMLSLAHSILGDKYSMKEQKPEEKDPSELTQSEKNILDWKNSKKYLKNQKKKAARKAAKKKK